MKQLVVVFLLVLAAMFFPGGVRAQWALPSISPTPSVKVGSGAGATESAKVEEKKTKITETTPEVKDKFATLLESQDPGGVVVNPLKHGIRLAVARGVPANTIVFLLLFPVVAAIIAASRHIAGVRGYGIFLPAALSVVFVSTGPALGVLLLTVILLVTTFSRKLIKGTVRLQYLPRLALLVWFVALGVLLAVMGASQLRVKAFDVSGIAVFPILVMILLTESFAVVQAGKSNREAVRLTVETVVLALISYWVLVWGGLQQVALLYPEMILLATALFSFVVGRYAGLRFTEYWRFRKLLRG